MLYNDIYMDIRNKIQEGVYTSGSALEGEEMLCNIYGTSRTTIRKAISKLKQDGYIHTRQGSGIFVNPPEFYEEQNLTTLSERIENQSNIENRPLSFKMIKANNEIAKIFNLPEGSSMYYYKRLRIVHCSLRVVEETYMPFYLFRDFNEEKTKGSVLKYLENDCKYKISHDIKNISAITVDEELSKLLGMKVGTATLQIIHKVYLIKSILAQYTKEIQTKNNIRYVSVR